MKRWIVGLLLCVAALGASVEVGELAPSFAYPGLDNVYHFSKNYLNKGWLICDFFATYCEPCKKEVPQLNALYNKHKDNGLQVLLFATDSEGRSKVAPYFQETPVDFPVLIDRYLKAKESFDVKVLPTLFVIDPQGRVVMRIDGYDEEIGLSEVDALLTAAFQ